MKYSSPDNWYWLELPTRWEVEEDDQCTSFRRFDGEGELQISAYRAPVPQSARDSLDEYLNDEKVFDAEDEMSVTTPYQLVLASFAKDGMLTKVGFASEGTLLLFITYVRDISAGSADDADVRRILASIELNPQWP